MLCLCLPIPFPIPSCQHNSNGIGRTVARRPRHARGTTVGAVFARWLCCCDLAVAVTVSMVAAIVATVILYVAVASVLAVAEATVLGTVRRG